MRARTWLAIGTALLLLLSACGDDEAAETSTSAGTTTTEAGATTTAGADPCAVELEATEIGITADTITIEVTADVGSTVIPGLARGSFEAVEAWADMVNENGGLACRTVEVREFDSKMDPTETRSGVIDSCENAFAMVGNLVLALGDISPITECVDAAGEVTGMPDILNTAMTETEACNPTTFAAAGGSHSCPPSEGEREYNVTTTQGDYIRQVIGGDAYGYYILAGSTPNIKALQMPSIAELRLQGFSGPAIGVIGSDPQSAYTPIVADMVDSGAQFVVDNADPSSFLLLQREAAAQGADIPYWFCNNCYDPDYVAGAGDLAQGVQIFVSYLPYEEAEYSWAMTEFVNRIETHDIFAMGSWLSALLFQEAVEDLVDQYGPNGLTRQHLIDAIGAIDDFDGGGIIGPTNPSQQVTGRCYVVLELNENGEYVRLYPEEPGTFVCGDVEQITIDPLVEMEAEE